MTTDLEKKFFEAFDIKPEEEKYCYWECKKPELENTACDNTKCEYYKHKIYYPEITDRHYLELICILNDYTGIDERTIKIEELKEELLKHCIDLIEYGLYNIDDIDNTKHQVQELFKGE